MVLRTRSLVTLAALVAALWTPLSATEAAEPLTRDQALHGLSQPAVEERLAAIVRLAEIGTMADADALVARLRDEDEQVHTLASAAMWQIWSRSGEAAIDQLFQRGMDEMQSANLLEALGTFSEIIEKKPAFAEGWNKRATIYFLLGQNELSLRDCVEVLKRNPNHFGALSGAAQIHLNLGQPERGGEFFERALKVNPNLSGAAEAARILNQELNRWRGETI